MFSTTRRIRLLLRRSAMLCPTTVRSRSRTRLTRLAKTADTTDSTSGATSSMTGAAICRAVLSANTPALHAAPRPITDSQCRPRHWRATAKNRAMARIRIGQATTLCRARPCSSELVPRACTFSPGVRPLTGVAATSPSSSAVAPTNTILPANSPVGARPSRTST